MNDCVSGLIDKIEERQKAIVTLRGMTGAEQLRAYSDCIQLIKEHFSEEQIKHCRKEYACGDYALERTGHWINIIDKDLHDYRTGNKLCFECSECRSQYTYKSNYCPNCGAKMTGESKG